MALGFYEGAVRLGIALPDGEAAGKEGKDTCSGDSGGPMAASGAGKRYQIGITSFGRGCAARKYPGVYTEVNAVSVRSFIVRAATL